MFEDIRLEDIAQLVEACDTASRQNKKRFVFRENVYTVSRCESFLSETFEYLDLKSEDAGADISKKMMQISELRNWALEVAQIDIITHEELCEMVSPELQNVVTALFLDEASEEGKIRIIKTKDNKFQVQRMTKGDFVDQGKPYKSLKQAEKERSTGQSSMQFESEISWDFDGVMVHITRNNFDNLDEDMKNDTVDAETVSVDGVHMPVLFVAEVRQMKDKKTEVMVQLKGKVKVIDKKDQKKFLDRGYTLAECMELQIEAAAPEKIMKDIAALEKMLTKFGGNSSAVKMKKVALERKIAKLEKELEGMEEDATVAAFLDMLNEYGYGKKKMKTEGGYGKKKMKDEELSPKQKKIDKNKNGKIDGSDLASLRKEGADDYEDHMMYDPKTGKGRMTTSYEDHLALKDKGWGHEKPTKESVNPYESLYGKPVDEAVRGNSGPVTVNKKKYSWGNMITVNHGTSVSYPLHPKQQLKIKNLKDGESTNFEDETGEKVAAKRVGDKVHLRQSGVNAKTTVDYKHFNESYGKPLDERKLTWKDWERQGNDAWNSREKRKDNPYKKKGQARTSWFDGWDNMQMDSDNGDFDESYGKMNASKMSSKEKAKTRALAKADKDAQPKDKVSLSKAPWDKKMKEDFVKQMNIILEGGELEQSIEESMSPKKIDMLKQSYESLRGKKISVENGMKLSKTLEKLDKESAIAIAKADIPFMSNLAMNKLIMNFGMSGADIKKSMKESVDEGFLDTFLGRNMKKGNVDKKKSKKSKNAEQIKLSTEIDRKLRLIDDLMQKVRPLGGNLGRLMSFRKLPIDKMTPKGMYIALNDWWSSIEDDLDDDSEDDNEKYAQSAEKLYDLWEEVGFKLSDYMWASGYNIKGIGQMAKIGFPAKKRTDPEWLKMNESSEKDLSESAGDMENAAAELEAYAKKSGGMDKNTFMRVANLLKTGHPDKLKSYVNNMDTDPREYVAMLLKKHIGKKSTEKMMDIKFRGESISWEDAETLRAAGVKLDEISGDMKKRYNKAALKDMDKQKNTLKRADDVGSKVVDGAVTDKASPSQTNSRFAKLDKIKQKANKKLTNRRKGLATPGKGSTTKVKDYFGMAEEISGTGYELYHRTLGSAIDTAITHAKLKFGIDITPDERMDVVGMGPRKPSNGKTNTYRLMGTKGKAIQVQVYNRGGSRPFELNMYKE